MLKVYLVGEGAAPAEPGIVTRAAQNGFPLTFPAAQTDEAAPPAPATVLQPRPRTSLRSVSLVTALTLGQLLLQFALQIVLARYFGSAAAMDAYVAALALPVVISSILSGSLAYVLVPIVAERRAAGSDREAARVASQIGLYVTAAGMLISAAMALTATPLAALLCPGFTVEEAQVTAGLTRTLAVLTLFNGLIGYLNALYQSYHRFARPAVAGVVGTLATLVYVAALHERQGVFAVAWGVVSGAAITVCLLLPLWLAQIWQARPLSLWPAAGARRCLALLVPLTLGALYWRLEPLLDRWLGSFLESGNLAHLGYAWRLVSGLMLIGTSGLSTVAFPAIAAHAAAGRSADLTRELAHATRFFLFLIVPVCVGLSLFATPVVRLLFEHGKFTASDTAAVGLLVAVYVGAIFGGGWGDLISRTFYAGQDMRTPVLVSAVVFTLAAGMKFALVRPWGAAGLAAASSAYYVLNAGLLTALLARRHSGQMLQGAGGTVLRSLGATALASGLAAAMIQLPTSWAVLPAALAAACGYLLIMWLLGDEFAIRIVHGAHAALCGRSFGVKRFTDRSSPTETARDPR